MNYPRYVEIDLTAKTVKVSTFKGFDIEGLSVWTVNSDLKGGPGQAFADGDHFSSIKVTIKKDGEEIALFEAE